MIIVWLKCKQILVKALVNLEIILFAVEEGVLNEEWPGPVSVKSLYSNVSIALPMRPNFVHRAIPWNNQGTRRSSASRSSDEIWAWPKQSPYPLIPTVQDDKNLEPWSITKREAREAQDSFNMLHFDLTCETWECLWFLSEHVAACCRMFPILGSSKTLSQTLVMNTKTRSF